ncbi:uncharacterized protein LOC103479207 isoform X3 [Poecilia reticulata]|uniref:uncharacterized protein LOC103479207 isoform X3 n=1 Tax=Poecilia reticulata TaxID=8081 RepID=UPI0004A46D62|nr:PREDICTED: uncharacterized protein LOC103479207 isoform X3 [Poecilia reticulata]
MHPLALRFVYDREKERGIVGDIKGDKENDIGRCNAQTKRIYCILSQVRYILQLEQQRATTGFKRTIPELTDRNHDNNPSSNNNLAGDFSTLAYPQNLVAMEISPSCTATDLETDICFSCGNQESQELPDPKVPKVEAVAENRNEKRDECDYLYFKTEEEKGMEVQYDSEREDEENGGRVETEEVERRGELEEQDNGRVDLEGDIQQGRNIVEHRGRVDGKDTKKEDSENYNLGKREIEGTDEGREGTDKVNIWITGILGEIKQDASSDQFFVNENPQSLLSEPSVITSDPPESTLKEAWKHDLDNRDDLSESHLSDSLKAKLAVVYSDSDFGEDQWLALACSDETDHSQENRDYADDTCIAQSMKDDEVEEVQTEVLKLEERVVDKQNEKKSKVMENSEEQMKSRRDFVLHSPSVTSTASSTDPDRRIPLDFYVQQETLSENVSTEHVDFLVARQQWKKMEEEVKGLPSPKPGLGAKRSFKGTHSSLYPPTRSPRLKHREIQPPMSKEPSLSFTLSPGSEDSVLDDSSFRSALEETENSVEREIQLTLEREEQHRRERGMIAQDLTVPSLYTLRTEGSMPRPPVFQTPPLSISPSPSCSSSLPRSMYHEMTAKNVIILEPDSSGSSSRNYLLSSAISGLSDWSPSLDVAPSENVIVVETSNLIIRSVSEFCLSTGPPPVETQESTFSSNPFFKLRSISSHSLVEQEIKMVRQREKEWRRQREELWLRKQEEAWRTGRERYDTVLVSPSLKENITFSVPVVPDRSVSSPSSPSRPRKMERSSLSCDHKFPLSLFSVPRRQNIMTQQWEASLLANQKKE